jgi:hypothetical protein
VERRYVRGKLRLLILALGGMRSVLYWVMWLGHEDSFLGRYNDINIKLCIWMETRCSLLMMDKEIYCFKPMHDHRIASSSWRYTLRGRSTVRRYDMRSVAKHRK